MRTAYNELQVSCRNRESLENSTLEEMERELGRVLKSNEELQGKKEMRRNGVELIARARIFCLLYTNSFKRLNILFGQGNFSVIDS